MLHFTICIQQEVALFDRIVEKHGLYDNSVAFASMVYTAYTSLDQQASPNELKSILLLSYFRTPQF